MGQQMSDARENGTDEAGLPVAIGPSEARPSLARSAPAAPFVSQLIAARERMATQRPRRQGTPEGAIGAYQTGARIAERRMPAGYRTTRVV
jgi:hypothetical protein